MATIITDFITPKDLYILSTAGSMRLDVIDYRDMKAMIKGAQEAGEQIFMHFQGSAVGIWISRKFPHIPVSHGVTHTMTYSDTFLMISPMKTPAIALDAMLENNLVVFQVLYCDNDVVATSSPEETTVVTDEYSEVDTDVYPY